MRSAIILAAVISGSAGEVNQASARAARAAKPGLVVATEAQNGMTVQVPRGSRLVVLLPANGTTGFAWTVAQAPSQLRLIGSDYEAAQSGSGPAVAGAAGRQKMTFEPVRAGAGVLRIVYRQSWEGGARGETFKLRVVSR